MKNSKDIRILIVDNEIDTDKNLKKLLEHLENKYSLVSRRKYIEDARQDFKYDIHSIDLLLVDIDFGASGRGAGLRFLKEVRETDKEIPVGIITQHRYILYAFEAGKSLATFYLLKDELFKDDNLNIKLLDDAIEQAVEEFSPLYNRDLMKAVNEHLAITYDLEEYGKQGTLAFCHWEDEIILETINSKCSGSRLKILDIGCGTGRYELLIKKYCKKDFELTAIDFAGRMLYEAKEKLESSGIYPEAVNPEWTNIKLKRAPAERLPFPDKEFDVIICGFGIPSYTKFNLSIPEANRVLRMDGFCIFTVYNKNALFNKVAKHFFPSAGDICPMASWVEFFPFSRCKNKEEGIYKLVPQGQEEKAFEIQPFTLDEFRGVLNRFGFCIEKIGTFPILYAITPIDLINRGANDDRYRPECVMEYKIPDIEKLREKFKEIFKKDYKKKVKEIEDKHKKSTSHNKGFSWRFYQLDKEYAEKLVDGGSYITAVVRKVKDAEKVNKYKE